MAAENENAAAGHQPYVPDNVTMPEFTWSAVLVGALLGIVFGASSLYLLLKVGMTVSASVPIAVLSITLFRAFSHWFGVRRATILENNIVQTTGSAGESIAFGVGVTMPALLLLGFEMSWERVMTVSVLGGLLGVLLMIPLRRAFIVKQHGKLKYPEGTACAEVLVAGEKGGSSARMVFIGFGIALLHKLLAKGLKLWPDEPEKNLYWAAAGGETRGLKGAAISGDLSPEMLGVGYLIGPRISCMMMAGAVLSFFVIGPLIATFGENLNDYVSPAKKAIDPETGIDMGLIRNMGPGEIYSNYLRYIGAGAVAAGGIISMFRALPLILGSIGAGLRDLRGGAAGSGAGNGQGQRTERDLSIYFVVFGCLGLVVVLAAVPQLGLGLTLPGILGAIMILVFGFLFVTVSSRLTGEVGSSSNPISGMTIATLLLTCLIFFIFGLTGVAEMLTAISIAAVVCIASSNGGTTSQDLKTGFLVGATPKYQQIAILVGALTSAVVIGGTMLLLDAGGTVYSKKNIPDTKVSAEVLNKSPSQKVGRPYDGSDANLPHDKAIYRFVFVREPESDRGWYLATDDGQLTYRVGTPIKRAPHEKMDNGEEAPERFKAPQPQLFQLITEGILTGKLQWGLIVVGVLVAVAMELLGISALPVAVGMYLGLSTAVPIFVGGMLRWLTDRVRGVSASEAETETSPGVLFSSGYIAGGTLCGLLLGFVFMVLPPDAVNLGALLGAWYSGDIADIVAVAAFAGLAAMLGIIGVGKSPEVLPPLDAPPVSPGPDTRIKAD
jgi:putative OPT family oligopeptide transporter